MQPLCWTCEVELRKRVCTPICLNCSCPSVVASSFQHSAVKQLQVDRWKSFTEKGYCTGDLRKAEIAVYALLFTYGKVYSRGRTSEGKNTLSDIITSPLNALLFIETASNVLGVGRYCEVLSELLRSRVLRPDYRLLTINILANLWDCIIFFIWEENKYIISFVLFSLEIQRIVRFQSSLCFNKYLPMGSHEPVAILVI